MVKVKALRPKFQKLLILGLSMAILGSGAYSLYKYFRYQPEPVPVAIDRHDLEQNEQSTETQITQTEESGVAEPTTKTSPPDELNLDMAFYAQAPFGNWDYPWQEACEEATILLIANEYYEHNWSREQFNDEILKMVEWENEHFGDYWHTTMKQTAQMLDEYLGLAFVIHENPTFDDIKAILAKGHFIVMPADGKLLYNPFFTNGGPVYHVFPIKGYKPGKLITNDVGTRRGADYVYNWETIDSAWHDYAIPMSNGGRLIIEVFPPDETPPYSF